MRNPDRAFCTCDYSCSVFIAYRMELDDYGFILAVVDSRASYLFTHISFKQ